MLIQSLELSHSRIAKIKGHPESAKGSGCANDSGLHGNRSSTGGHA
jgi:hypothetical protein